MPTISERLQRLISPEKAVESAEVEEKEPVKTENKNDCGCNKKKSKWYQY
jgi:hypothetical protein